MSYMVNGAFDGLRLKITLTGDTGSIDQLVVAEEGVALRRPASVTHEVWGQWCRDLAARVADIAAAEAATVESKVNSALHLDIT